MRKGDARRLEIVQAAEKLFYMKGYENTSIQDVLLAAGISKGGFYHHFESKNKLLEEICIAHVEQSCQRAQQAVEECTGDAVQKFNVLFDAGGFFEPGDTEFTSLMIRVIYQDGCVQLRDMMQRLRVEKYEQLLTQVIHEGIENQLFFTAYPDSIARLILMMDNALTDEISRALPDARETAEDIGAFIDLLGAYRSGVERLLEAPYGTIQLVALKRLVDAMRAFEETQRRQAFPQIDLPT
jgi:AcrR family transcriptional regulator